MIEIRNDEIADEASQHKWAELLSMILAGVKLLPDALPVTTTRQAR